MADISGWDLIRRNNGDDGYSMDAPGIFTSDGQFVWTSGAKAGTPEKSVLVADPDNKLRNMGFVGDSQADGNYARVPLSIAQSNNLPIAGVAGPDPQYDSGGFLDNLITNYGPSIIGATAIPGIGSNIFNAPGGASSLAQAFGATPSTQIASITDAVGPTSVASSTANNPATYNAFDSAIAAEDSANGASMLQNVGQTYPEYLSGLGGSAAAAAAASAIPTSIKTSELDAALQNEDAQMGTDMLKNTGQSYDGFLKSVASGGAAAATQTALQKVFSGNGTAADYASLLGQVAPGLLGAYASNQQAKSLSDIASRYEGYGAPSRARYEASMSPGFDPTTIPGYKGALDTTSESVLRKLSATGGNPFGNPGGLIEANKAIVNGTALPAVQDYQRQNAATGGISSYNTAGQAAQTGALGANANVYNAIGYGIDQVTNPQSNSLDSILKQLAPKISGAYGLK